MQAVRLVRLQDKNGNVISTYIKHGHLYTISKDFGGDKQVRKSAKESKQPSKNKIKTDFPRSESLASNSSKNLKRVKSRAGILLHSSFLISQLHIHRYSKYTQQHRNTSSLY